MHVICRCDHGIVVLHQALGDVRLALLFCGVEAIPTVAIESAVGNTG